MLRDYLRHYAGSLFHEAGATTPAPQGATTCFPVGDLVARLPHSMTRRSSEAFPS